MLGSIATVIRDGKGRILRFESRWHKTWNGNICLREGNALYTVFERNGRWYWSMMKGRKGKPSYSPPYGTQSEAMGVVQEMADR